MEDISLNFGALKDSVIKYSTKKFINENKLTVNDFAEEVEKNPVLKKQYLLYKIFEDAKPFKKDHLAERFINQSLRLFEGAKWNDVIYNNKLLRKKYIGENHVSSFSGKNKLFNAIHTLLESKCHFIDPAKDQEAYETLLEHLTRDIESENKEDMNEEKEYPNLSSWKYITNLAISNFNKRYEHLEESDRDLLKILMSNNNHKQNYLKDLKEDNIKKIDSLLESKNDKNKEVVLESFREKINKIDDSDFTKLNDAIISCYELKNSL